MDTKYRLMGIPAIEWDVKVKVDQVENDGKLFASASFDRENDTANVSISVYGFKVSLTAKPVDTKLNELFIMTYAIDRARNIASSYTGYDLPLMIGFPAEMIERNLENIPDQEQPTQEEVAPASASGETDAPVS